MTDAREFRHAPPGAYSFLVSRRGTTDGQVGVHWEVIDVRLYGKSIRDDYHAIRGGLRSSVFPGLFRTREGALEAARRVAEEHRELHVWWVPDA